MEDYVCGIDPKFITNRTQFQSLIQDMTCPMCRNVVCQPLECKECQTLICENCYFILTIAEQNCITPNCKGKVAKANKFVREILCALKITCSCCMKTAMNYPDYLRHIAVCKAYLSNPLRKKLATINELNKDLQKAQVEQQKKATLTPTRFDQECIKKLMTSNLPMDAKMELYNAVVMSNVVYFKQLIYDKKYPVLEEISAKGHGWTAFHYAMHYGKVEIIKVIMEYLQSKGLLAQALCLRSADSRCPVLCLLKSKDLTPEVKPHILAELLKSFPIALTDEVSKELNLRQCAYLKPAFRYK